MSQAIKKTNVRELDRDRLAGLIQYGDLNKIASRVPYTYDYVSRVVRKRLDNDLVWSAVADYMDSRSSLELSARTLKLVGHEAA